MAINTPEILYKYRKVDKRTISMLLENKLYSACALEFNDPFDCSQLENSFDEIRLESVEKLVLMNSQVSPHMITYDKILLLMEEVRKHPDFIKIINKQKKLFENFIKNQGIISFSGINDSILMWSHYADYHKGFCIGFKNNLGIELTLVRPVIYSEKEIMML